MATSAELPPPTTSSSSVAISECSSSAPSAAPSSRPPLSLLPRQASIYSLTLDKSLLQDTLVAEPTKSFCSRPPPSLLPRQASVYSLPMEEQQDTLGEPTKSLGSMTLGEFLNHIWAAEEGRAMPVAIGSGSPASLLDLSDGAGPSHGSMSSTSPLPYALDRHGGGRKRGIDNSLEKVVERRQRQRQRQRHMIKNRQSAARPRARKQIASMAGASMRRGLLVALKGLLRSLGMLPGHVGETIVEYEQLPDSELEATIQGLQAILRRVHLDKGSSRHPRAVLAYRTPISEPHAVTEHDPDRGIVIHQPKLHLAEEQHRQRRQWTLSGLLPISPTSTLTPPLSTCHTSTSIPRTPISLAPPSPQQHQQHQQGYRTCIGSHGVTCNIDEDGRVVPIGGGHLFRQRLAHLVELYIPRIHILLADQLELDKTFVLTQLEREFGMGWSQRIVLCEMAQLLQHRRDNFGQR